MRLTRTFIAACVISVLAHSQTVDKHQSLTSSSTARSIPNSSTANVKGEFKLINSGEIKTPYGIRLAFTTFKAPDGVGLTVFYLTQADPTLATQAFNEELAMAVSVGDRSPKTDKSGHVVGERAQILTRSTMSISPFPAVAGPDFPAVMWTDGSAFHEIKSSSLRKVLEFEKVYRY